MCRHEILFPVQTAPGAASGPTFSTPPLRPRRLSPRATRPPTGTRPLNACCLQQLAQLRRQLADLPLHHATHRIRQCVLNFRERTSQHPGAIDGPDPTSVAQMAEKITDEKRDTLRLLPDRRAEIARESVRGELQFQESVDVGGS